VIITGRDVPPELIKMADIVTEMKEVKHIYKEGVVAVQGLDY
jgi:cob(I)alamin adenosyltransferase